MDFGALDAVILSSSLNDRPADERGPPGSARLAVAFVAADGAGRRRVVDGRRRRCARSASRDRRRPRASARWRSPEPFSASWAGSSSTSSTLGTLGVTFPRPDARRLLGRVATGRRPVATVASPRSSRWARSLLLAGVFGYVLHYLLDEDVVARHARSSRLSFPLFVLNLLLCAARPPARALHRSARTRVRSPSAEVEVLVRLTSGPYQEQRAAVRRDPPARSRVREPHRLTPQLALRVANLGGVRARRHSSSSSSASGRSRCSRATSA